MIEFVLAATLLLRDPPGDAVGAGGLVPPSAEQYRNMGSFDLLEIQILESSMLALTIEMGALPNPAGLANGFSNAIIDVYVDLGEGGAEALLPGPEMRMPPGTGWEVALRITGDGATAYRSDDDPSSEGPSVSYPVQVQAEDRVIRVETPFESTEIRGVYALTGVYDPFVASGWRPFVDTPSPWAFASTDQRRPVIDLLAPDEVAQADAIRTGVLPMPRNRTAGAMWMLLMAVGVLVAGMGLVLRRMVRPAQVMPVDGSAVAEDDAASPSSATGVGESTTEPAPAETDPTPISGASAPQPLPDVELPTFLPALPPPSPAHRGATPVEAERRPVPQTFGEPESWLHHPEEDPEAQTWRGDAPAIAETEPSRADGEREPGPERADGEQETASERADGEPELELKRADDGHTPEPSHETDASEPSDEKA